jgi:hypothetical protein
VTYKLFASIILRRLQNAGAERRLTDTQFGFRRRRGTTDAIFALRRHIEKAWAQRSGQVMCLALDWQRAFDSINPEALMVALRRFGLPAQLVNTIALIYADRRFRVMDGGQFSEEKKQAAGISQGCPLSPFLFVMLMTVLMHDAVRSLPAEDQRLHEIGSLASLLYADDTLLLGVSAPALQRLLDAVATVGAQYGLALHWGKFQLIQIRCHRTLRKQDGQVIADNDTMTYLGASIAADGIAKSELSRRLGAAWAEFRKLAKLWNHSNLPKARKLKIFDSLMVMCSMSTACLNVSDQRRLDGSQARCLRLIVGVKPSFISRISNKDVLQKAGCKTYGQQLLKAQLQLFGKIARAPDTDVLRRLTFCPSSIRPAMTAYVRKVGRPRHEWATKLLENALLLSGGTDNLEQQLRNETTWNDFLNRHI